MLFVEAHFPPTPTFFLKNFIHNDTFTMSSPIGDSTVLEISQALQIQMTIIIVETIVYGASPSTS